MTNTVRRLMAAVLCAAAVSLAVPRAEVAAAERGFGSIEGQIVLDGEVPPPDIKIAKGDQSVKDAAVCAAQNLYSQALVIDPDTKGIANVFLYLGRAPGTIHPDLKQPAKKEIAFDQKNCQFIPHALFVQADQTVMVKSDDPIPHNTHTHPLRNDEQNQVIPANDRKGVPYPFTRGEPLPVSVTCDFHPHMQAYWLVLDHPYGAITGPDGKFRIENLPVGEHTFRVWHELPGYVLREYKVTVEDGKTTKLEPVKVPAAKFQKK